MHNKLLIALVALAFITVTSLSLKFLKEPIGGTVLHLPLHNQVYANHFPLPWIDNSIVSSLMFRTLLLPDHTLVNYTPDLAQSYTVNNEKTVYTFKMQKNQKWSDGEIIKPEDVVFSIETALKNSFINQIYIATFQSIEKMEIVDNAVVFHLKTPHFAFLQVIAQFAIMPKHILENENLAEFYRHDFWENPVSSGMYRIAGIDEAHFLLEQNPHYSGAKSEITDILLYTNTNNAKLDYFYTNSIEDMVHFRAMRTYTEHEIKMHYYRFLVFNMEGDDGFTNPAMQDWSTRRAIAHALHKSKLLYELYFDIGYVLNSIGVGEESIPYVDYNPERAKVLLKEANYDFKRPLRLAYTHTDPTSVALIAKLANYFEAVGFEVEKKLLHGNIDLYHKREYDILLKDLAAFEPLEWYLDYDSTNATMSKIFGNKGEYDTLLEELKLIDTIAEKEFISAELSKLGIKTVYKIPLFKLNQSVYINADRVELPENFIFGNSWYHFDYDFANWKIKNK